MKKEELIKFNIGITNKCIVCNLPLLLRVKRRITSNYCTKCKLELFISKYYIDISDRSKGYYHTHHYQLLNRIGPLFDICYTADNFIEYNTYIYIYSINKHYLINNIFEASDLIDKIIKNLIFEE